MKYNGVEVELITAGYWPEGEKILCSDSGISWHELPIVCLHNGRAFYTDGDVAGWKYYALKPAKPAPRRLTNREVYRLWRSGWDAMTEHGDIMEPGYSVDRENDLAPDGTKLRATDSDEWVEPTSDLLEGGK